MSQGELVKLMSEAVRLILMASAPMLGFGLMVGLLVSIFQATTQIQEQTLSFVPKIVAVLVSFVVFSPWIMTMIIEFTNSLYMNMSQYLN